MVADLPEADEESGLRERKDAVRVPFAEQE
jgi:hypothetical protein